MNFTFYVSLRELPETFLCMCLNFRVRHHSYPLHSTSFSIMITPVENRTTDIESNFVFMFSSADLKTRAHDLGFNLVGITPALPSPYLDSYFRWVEAGMQGTMNYMARPDRQARRLDL